MGPGPARAQPDQTLHPVNYDHAVPEAPDIEDLWNRTIDRASFSDD